MTLPNQPDQPAGRPAGKTARSLDQADLAEKVVRLQAKAAKAGFISDGRDDKALMGDLWGEA